MTEDEFRTESPLPAKEIELGEWFRPFESYHSIPYTIQRTDYDYWGRNVDFVTPELGKWGISLQWDHDWYQGAKNEGTDQDLSLVVIEHDGEKVISPPEVVNLQEDIEIRLVQILVSTSDVLTDNAPLTPRPFWLTLKAPSGKQYRAQFPFITRWFSDERQHNQIIIPDVANIMERIEMRIDKIDK